jgi:hypothetical protein
MGEICQIRFAEKPRGFKKGNLVPSSPEFSKPWNLRLISRKMQINFLPVQQQLSQCIFSSRLNYWS